MNGIRRRSALIDLLLGHISQHAAQHLFLLAATAGLSGTALAALALGLLTGQAEGLVPALLFAVLLILFAVAARALHVRSAAAAEDLRASLRGQATAQLLAAEALPAQPGFARQMARIPPRIADATVMATLALLCLTQLAGWIAYLSWAVPQAALAIGAAVAVTAGWQAHHPGTSREADDAMDVVQALIRDRDAARLNTDRAGDLADRAAMRFAAADTARSAATADRFRGTLLLLAMLQLLLGVALFGGRYADGLLQGLDPLPVALALLLAATPLALLAQLAPSLLAAERAAAQWHALQPPIATATDSAATVPFGTIRLRESAPPLDLSLRAGETLLLSGDRAARSRILRVLAGLDAPRTGTIEVDGVALDIAGRTLQRMRTAGVLPDTRPFPRPLPSRAVSAQEVEAMLVALGLDPQDHWRDGAFQVDGASRTESARLAFVGAVLEARPLLVIDNPDLERDSDFRRMLASDWIARLTARGVTVALASDDPAFIPLANTHLILDDTTRSGRNMGIAR